MINDSKYRDEMVEAGRRLYMKGMVASNSGNLSCRISENRILITPTGVCKGDMKPEDILTVDLDGNVIAGDLKPTSEMKMHLAVYKKRADVKAIVHAHPPKATAFAVAGIALDKTTLPEVIINLGSVELCEYGTPTTDAVPRSIEKHIMKSDALLLANHGALTVGDSIMSAYFNMETLEHFASITIYARMLGGEKVIPETEVKELRRLRKDAYGKG